MNLGSSPSETTKQVTIMEGVILQFSTTKDFGSWAIRQFTWSDWSHVDIVMPDGYLLGARQDGGVKKRQPGYGKFSKVQHMIAKGAPESVYEYALSQWGKPYDWTSILNFGMHRDWRENDSWFCSELVMWSFEQAKWPLLNPEIPASRWTPRDVYVSPKLETYTGLIPGII